jgi:hypothetical protein
VSGIRLTSVRPSGGARGCHVRRVQTVENHVVGVDIAQALASRDNCTGDGSQ